MTGVHRVAFRPPAPPGQGKSFDSPCTLTQRFGDPSVTDATLRIAERWPHRLAPVGEGGEAVFVGRGSGW